MKETIHPYQRIILRKLMYNETQRFSDLQIDNMSSKHFNYHLGKLRELGYVEKNGISYSLTVDGKMYIAFVDEANMKVEKLPKVSVVVYPERVNDKNETEILISRRLKHPNFGKVVGIGGKIRFGETFYEAASRELKEETGLTGVMEQRNIVRKIGLSDEKAVLDILFVLFSGFDLKGDLIRKFEDQENFWCKLEDIPKLENVSHTLPEFIAVTRKLKIPTLEYISELEG